LEKIRREGLVDLVDIAKDNVKTQMSQLDHAFQLEANILAARKAELK
jgi:hypothetical protein